MMTRPGFTPVIRKGPIVTSQPTSRPTQADLNTPIRRMGPRPVGTPSERPAPAARAVRRRVGWTKKTKRQQVLRRAKAMTRLPRKLQQELRRQQAMKKASRAMTRPRATRPASAREQARIRAAMIVAARPRPTAKFVPSTSTMPAAQDFATRATKELSPAGGLVTSDSSELPPVDVSQSLDTAEYLDDPNAVDYLSEETPVPLDAYEEGEYYEEPKGTPWLLYGGIAIAGLVLYSFLK